MDKTEIMNWAEMAVEMAEMMGFSLDYSMESIYRLELMAQMMHEEYKKGTMKEDTVRILASAYGAYLGEVLLKNGLKDFGYDWTEADGEIGIAQEDTTIYPVSKVYKRITQGPYHDLTDFYEVVLGLVRGEIDPQQEPRMHFLSEEAG